MRFEAAFLLAGATLAAAQVPVWGQCGGIGHSGGTTCQSGNTCVSYNPYYSQCIPSNQAPNPEPTPTPTPTSTPVTPTSTYSPPPVVTTTSTPTQPGGSGPNPSASAGANGLHAKIWAKGGRYYGTACDQNTLGISQIASIVREEFGVLTPENSMKWDSTEGSRGNFNLGGGDYLVNWAQQNGKLVRGHTLVWHSQLPSWVQNIGDRNTLQTVMENHINTVMGRWKGKIFHWDVVNEVFEDNGSYRNSVFYRLMGEEFIALSFRLAARVDPACKLYINDYNLDYTSSKLTNFITLANKLKNAGVPIHGVGTQSHLIVGNGAIPTFSNPLNQLAATGLDVAITELDIRMTLPSSSSKVSQQNADFTSVHRACLNQPKCVGITVWGIDDGHSWIPGTFPGTGDGLLWNSSYQKKSAYNAVVAALA